MESILGLNVIIEFNDVRIGNMETVFFPQFPTFVRFDHYRLQYTAEVLPPATVSNVRAMMTSNGCVLSIYLIRILNREDEHVLIGYPNTQGRKPVRMIFQMSKVLQIPRRRTPIPRPLLGLRVYLALSDDDFRDDIVVRLRGDEVTIIMEDEEFTFTAPLDETIEAIRQQMANDGYTLREFRYYPRIPRLQLVGTNEQHEEATATFVTDEETNEHTNEHTNDDVNQHPQVNQTQ